ncbi:uncharacterized protein LOC119607961 [Lucilia sericata]|uniref:uncharacterized protein LOC119607961 n=1 Tax=Lucilia sericata TaxID=13632 RepID=UPI0018A861F3|nr:uncharacterized protein LOC119607961 [Lucilia sericata]
MSSEVEFKLQDLAKIALGAPQLTNVNIAILHSLIDILLKKLNCQTETVSLNAHDSKHLENILKTAKLSPLVFSDENVEIIAPKLERLDKLQERVSNLDKKLSNHLEELQRNDNFNETVFNWENWPTYGCEDLCTTCDPENEMACKLLKNTDFLKKLLRRISSPMVDRIFLLEEKIEKLSKEFTNFIKRTEEEYLKIKLLEKCILEIETLRQKVEENQTQFLYTMEEIQDMLDTKLDKIHMPALKKYILENFQRIDQCVKTMQDKRQCNRAAGIIMEGLRCMSCGETKVCSEVGVQSASMLPDMGVKSPKVIRKYCGVLHKTVDDWKGIKKPRVKSLNLSDVVKVKREKIINVIHDDDSAIPKCRKAGEDFDLMEGSDGKLYRKG